MKFSLTARALMLAAILVLGATAADVNGKWVASFTTPDGQTRENTINLKADGEKLSGSISGRGGDTAIEEGKLAGDEISFSVTRNFGGNEVKMKYKGKVTGNEMKLNVEMGDRSFEMTAKRAVS